MSSLYAATAAWKTYGIPDDMADLSSPERRRLRFAFLQSLYDGTAYTGTGESVGQRYRDANTLYTHTRQIVNPTKSLCDFYAAHIYTGPFSPDGTQSIEGEDAALPLVTLIPGGANEEAALRAAFGQLSHGWWAWDTMMAHRILQTAILGTNLIELVDDPTSGKVMLNLTPPTQVEEVTLDFSGNLKGYILAYTMAERGAIDTRTGQRERSQTFRYRKVVDGAWFRHYRDGHLEREHRNPYGFVPAVWDRHGLGWGSWGEPALLGSQTAADELNELWSHADDRLHQLFSAPLVVGGASAFEKQTLQQGTRSEVSVFGVPAGGQASTIAFSLGEVMTSLEKIQDSIAVECPELRVYDRIRDMTQATGPGIRRAVADVEHRVNNKAALYDRQTIKLLQMGTAIAGWRVNNGDWGSVGDLTEQQRVFLAFGLESFKAGQLDCMLLPRELVKPTFQERIEEQEALERLQDRASLAVLGLPEDEIAKRLAERDARRSFAFDLRER
ncbi:MAG: hypothetical protein M3509_06800, partial [Chloroflexota bacterium]|nr:hypothetical protein [Chloroflexota bacterium]